MKKVVVVSAHADDESFGMGASIHRMIAEGVEVHWLILSKLWEPKWSATQVERRQDQIVKVTKSYPMASTTQWDYPDNKLDSIARDSLQNAMIHYLDKIQPDTIFTPGPWDFNFEHRVAYEILEMSAKPYYSKYIKTICAYEIPSSTEWAFSDRPRFNPQIYWDVEDFLDLKQSTCSHYEEEVHAFPHCRSMEYLEVLAKKRGGESGLKMAESFYLVRQIN